MIKKWSPIIYPLLILSLFWGIACLLEDTLVPLILSFFLAYLFFPLVLWLEEKKINRKISIVSVFSLSFLIIILALILILPNLYSDIAGFIEELPGNIKIAMAYIENIARSYGFEVQLKKETIFNFLKEHFSKSSFSILKPATQLTSGIFSSVIAFVIALLNLFLFPVFFYYVMSNYETIRKEFSSLIPKKYSKFIEKLFEKFNVVFSGYIRGQLVVALCMGILYALGLTIAGLRFGWVIGLIAGFLNIIPYVGFIVGLTSAVIVALANFTGMGLFWGIAITFAVVQVLESFYITPKLVGNKVGLSALSTMLVLIIGGNVGGIMGMLVAIPVGGVIKQLYFEVKDEYFSSRFYEKG